MPQTGQWCYSLDCSKVHLFHGESHPVAFPPHLRFSQICTKTDLISFILVFYVGPPKEEIFYDHHLCNGWKVCSNGTTSVLRSVPCLVLDKVRFVSSELRLSISSLCSTLKSPIKVFHMS